MTFIRDALRGERRCIVGHCDTPDGVEPVYDLYVRASWADAEIAYLRDALERIASRGPFERKTIGPTECMCATCRHWWERDAEEHHDEHCAYVIARDALNPLLREGGGQK